MSPFRGNPFDDELLRLRLIFVAMLTGLLVLGAALWRIQVAHGKKYESSQLKQSIRRVRMPGMRGRVYDRNGQVLVDNRPSYGVALYLEELRQPGGWSKTVDRVESLVKELSGIIGVPPVITRADIQGHWRRRLPLPLLAWRDLDDQTMARLAERASAIPGVDIYPEAVRDYPFKSMACHVLGYVGRADPSQREEEPYHYYLPEMIGRSGVEKALDEDLRGEAGGRLVRVDVAGYRREDMYQREAKAGRDVMLALDARIQKLAEETLGGAPGAVVVLSPDSGDVLAMASAPGFDPNGFVPFIRPEDWAVLSTDELKPMLNRATAGAYAPGSVFKPVTALAALESGRCVPENVFECPGYFQLGRAVFRCWYHTGHGPLDLRGGLEHSCNVYFFHLGLMGGPEYIAHQATALGLGRKTGIDLDYEATGLVPDDAWKRRVFRDAWRDGDTCNLSIGQGALTVTPLQMAVVTAAIANGGHVWRPRLVLGRREPGAEVFTRQQPVLENTMNWTPRFIRAVREGMRSVVMSPAGTGRAMRVDRVTMAGKTGTAEFGPRDARKRHAWMIAFAPYDQPRYAVVMVVDEGVSGSETAAPRMHRLMSGLFHERAAELEAQG
jgi:penicillin-binding protein 2